MAHYFFRADYRGVSVNDDVGRSSRPCKTPKLTPLLWPTNSPATILGRSSFCPRREWEIAGDNNRIFPRSFRRNMGRRGVSLVRKGWRRCDCPFRNQPQTTRRNFCGRADKLSRQPCVSRCDSHRRRREFLPRPAAIRVEFASAPLHSRKMRSPWRRRAPKTAQHAASHHRSDFG